jgi:hypothetical protein
MEEGALVLLTAVVTNSYLIAASQPQDVAKMVELRAANGSLGLTNLRSGNEKPWHRM